jgi:hypothetical protein
MLLDQFACSLTCGHHQMQSHFDQNLWKKTQEEELGATAQSIG